MRGRSTVTFRAKTLSACSAKFASSVGDPCSGIPTSGRTVAIARHARAAKWFLAPFYFWPVGSGNFLPPQTVAAGFQPIDVVIADLNADGLLDLAIANLGTPGNPATASLSVLLNNSASPGRFLAATNYATGERSRSVSVGDLNGDGKADLAVANAGVIGNTGSVSVLFQNPGAPGTVLPAVNRPGTSQPLGVVIADLNGDNLLDIALADEGVRILFQIPVQPGTFQSPILVGN